METITQTNNQLVAVIQSSGVAQDRQTSMIQTLQVFFDKIAEWDKLIESLVITDINDTGKMKMAREGRLDLKNKRIDCSKIIDKERDTVKAKMNDFVVEDKMLLKCQQIMDIQFKNLESKLEEKEKFAERKEQERKSELKGQRTLLLLPYVQFGINPDMYDLENMPEEVFTMTLSGIQTSTQEKIRQAEEAEKKRLAEIEEEKERQRLRDLELAELKKKQEEQEREAEIERKKLAAQKELQTKRLGELWKYNNFIPADFDMSNLYELSENNYANVLKEAMKLHDEAVKKSELEFKEQQKKEQEAKEAKEKADKIIREQQQKEAAQIAERERLETGSDKHKLSAWANRMLSEASVLANTPPTVKTKKAQTVIDAFIVNFTNAHDDLKRRIEKL